MAYRLGEVCALASQIKVVIFDQGGVLTRGGEKGTNEKAASRAMGLDYVIEVPDLTEALKRGQIDNAQYVDEINKRFNPSTRLTYAMWDDVYALLEREPLSYDFVDLCRDSGRRVGLLSNINPAMAERLRIDGSYDGFDPIVLSCYAKCAKPDREIYELVERALPGILPGEILFLDDQKKCVDGARSRGWQALEVTSPEQMVRDAGELLGFL